MFLFGFWLSVNVIVSCEKSGVSVIKHDMSTRLKRKPQGNMHAVREHFGHTLNKRNSWKKCITIKCKIL